MTTLHDFSRPSQMLTLTEAARDLNISLDALFDLCVAGKLTCFRVGYTSEVLRVMRRDLDACRQSVALQPESHHV